MPPASRAIMWSVSKIAERDGVSVPAVSKKVKQLAERHALKVERDPNGRVIAVNVVEYDRLRGRTDDPSKAQAPRPANFAGTPSDDGNDESYNEALRQKTWHEAEKRRLELEELKGQLMRVDKVSDALARSSEVIIATLERLHHAADDITQACAGGGTPAVRTALKAIEHRQRTEISTALLSVAKMAPAIEEETEPHEEST